MPSVLLIEHIHSVESGLVEGFFLTLLQSLPDKKDFLFIYCLAIYLNYLTLN